MLDPTLLKTCAAGDREGVELLLIQHLLVDAILIEERRLRGRMLLVIVADPGIALPNGEMIRQLIAKAPDEVAADRYGRPRPDPRSAVELPYRQERMTDSFIVNKHGRP